MTDKTEQVTRILELIDVYGADIASWPEEEQSASAALLAAKPDLFETALLNARRLDEAFADLSVPEPSSDLVQSIMSAAPKRKPVSVLARLETFFFPRQGRFPGRAILASLAIGTVSGYAYASTSSSGDFLLGSDPMSAAYSDVFTDTYASDWQSWVGEVEATDE